MSDMPVMTSAIITSLVTAVITLLTAFGVTMTPEQTAAILGLIGVVAPWVVWYVSHRTTTPRANPTDDDGTPLIRQADGMPTNAAVRSMAKR